MSHYLRALDALSRGLKFNSQHPHVSSHISNSSSRASDTLTQIDIQAKHKIKLNDIVKELKFKNKIKKIWRDGSVVRNTDYYTKGREFKCQQLHGGSQPCVIRSNALFWCSRRQLQCTHKIHKPLKKLKKKKKSQTNPSISLSSPHFPPKLGMGM